MAKPTFPHAESMVSAKRLDYLTHVPAHGIPLASAKRHSSLIIILEGFCVIPSRVELETYCLEGSCSIQLSYGTMYGEACAKTQPQLCRNVTKFLLILLHMTD